MKIFNDKLKLIFFPFLIIAVSFIIIYSFLNWALFIKADFLHVKEDILKFWLPFGLPLIPVLIWLRPRIKLLRFKNDNASFGYQFLASLAITFPTIVAQNYLETATGKLTKLANITQFEKAEKTKYYVLDKYFVDKSNAGILSTATISGKHNENLNYAIYITMPVFSKVSDTTTDKCSYWLGKKYAQQISNKLNNQEKDAKYQEFAEKTQIEIDTADFQQFIYLEKTGNTDDHDEFNKAVKKSRLVPHKDPVIFTAVNENYESRNGGKFGWIFKSFGIGSLVFLIFLIFPGFHEASVDKFKNGINAKDTDLKEMFDLLIPKQGYFATPIIILLNIFIYLAMVFSGLGLISFKAEDLLRWGGNYRPVTINGDWWRLLTNIFLHGGLMHIVSNMAALLFAGIFLEPLLGRTKYTFIYLITGIAASCASIWWHPATVSIGASGAIFGLYGFFLALLLLKVFPKDFSKGFLTSILIFIGYNLILGLTCGIDNAAHIGGLLSGFITGAFLSPSLKRHSNAGLEVKRKII